MIQPGMSGDTADHSPDVRWRARIPYVLLVLVAVLPYLPTLTFGFVYDDHLAIEENPHLNLWPGFQRIFLSDVWTLSASASDSNYYRPMFLVAYHAVFHAAGARPVAFHLVNLLFHVATTLMVFTLSLRIWKKTSIGVIASVLFALHPTHAEPVAWVAALSELGYTLFLIVGLYFYIQEHPSRWTHVLAMASFAVALLWKESAVAFVPLIVLWDVVVTKQWRWKLWGAAAAVTLAYLMLRVVALGGLAPAVHYQLTLTTQLLTALSNVGFYVRKLIAPLRLSAVYGTEFVSTLNAKIVLVLVLAALGAWKLRGRQAWSALWIVVGLLPVLLVSRVVVPLADRDLYLPSIGFAWLLAVALDSLTRRVAVPACGALAIVSLVLLVQQLPVWRDDIPLFKQALERQPDSSSIRLLLASELARRNQSSEAIHYLDEILAVRPDDIQALVDKAGVQLSARDFAGVRSTCAKVFAFDPNSARCWYDMGYLEEVEGNLAEAREKFAKAYKLDPELSQALLHQGLMEARTGSLESAAKTLELAVQRLPTAPALNNLGTVYAERGDLKKAVDSFRTALRVDPSFELARHNLERAIADAQTVR